MDSSSASPSSAGASGSRKKRDLNEYQEEETVLTEEDLAKLGHQLLVAAFSGDVASIRAVVQSGLDISEFRDQYGRTALHYAAAAGHSEAAAELMAQGISYNVQDSEGQTPAESATDNGHPEIYEQLLQEGIRSEILLNLMQRGGESMEDEGAATAATANSDYLSQRLTYYEGKLIDAEGNGVMMGWETPLMDQHARVICPHEGLDVLNVGFGLGIIDEFLQRQKPRTHTIIEAHPDVYAKMLADGWDKKPGVRIVFGRWQDVLPSLGTYDGIFFDTFGEYYDQLYDFHRVLPRLLRDTGIYSFFNGLAATNIFFHDMYCRIASLDLTQQGYSTEYVAMDMDASGADWEGIIGKYWTLKKYFLPICRPLPKEAGAAASSS